MGEEVAEGGVVQALFGAPAEGAAGVVVVPREHVAAALTGVDGGEHRRGHRLPHSTLPVRDSEGAASGPLPRRHPGPFRSPLIRGRRAHRDPDPGEGSPPAADAVWGVGGGGEEGGAGGRLHSRCGTGEVCVRLWSLFPHLLSTRLGERILDCLGGRAEGDGVVERDQGAARVDEEVVLAAVAGGDQLHGGAGAAGFVGGAADDGVPDVLITRRQ